MRCSPAICGDNIYFLILFREKWLVFLGGWVRGFLGASRLRNDSVVDKRFVLLEFDDRDGLVGGLVDLPGLPGLGDGLVVELGDELAELGDVGGVAEIAHDVAVEGQVAGFGDVGVEVAGMEVGHIVGALAVEFPDEP